MKVLIIKYCNLEDEFQYRLDSYHNFTTKISKLPGVEVESYGYKHKDYSEDKTIQDVVTMLYGEEYPDVIYLWSPQALKESDFNKIPSRKYLFWTDTPSTNGVIVDGVKKHKVKFDAVFHNYLYELDILKDIVDADRFEHHPCWSSDIYDYDGREKTIDFLLTGTITSEYEFRSKYKNLVHLLEGVTVDRLGMISNQEDDNNKFKDSLLSSKFSLVDGGVNGRVVPRYFESSLAKSVVISPDLGKELEANGFKDGINCILFDRDDSYENIAKKINESVKDWERLSENAYDLVYNNHTTEKRIEALIKGFKE